jgi:glutaredoxin
MQNLLVADGDEFAMLGGNSQAKIMKPARLYTRQLCGWCQDAKAYLREHHIAFEDIDVGRDPSANAEMQRLSGQHYVPTSVVNGKVLANFDVDELAKFLATLH